MKVGDKIVCKDNNGIPESFWLEVGKVYIIRDIGDRTGGVRLEGVHLYSDSTGYEKSYGKKHFELAEL